MQSITICHDLQACLLFPGFTTGTVQLHFERILLSGVVDSPGCTYFPLPFSYAPSLDQHLSLSTAPTAAMISLRVVEFRPLNLVVKFGSPRAIWKFTTDTTQSGRAGAFQEDIESEQKVKGLKIIFHIRIMIKCYD